MPNPFVDKSDIKKHKAKVNELAKRNEINLQIFNNSVQNCASPVKELAIDSMMKKDVSFALILDENSKAKYQSMKDHHNQLIEHNQTLH